MRESAGSKRTERVVVRTGSGRVRVRESRLFRLSIEDMDRAAAAKGGRCLSPYYRPSPAKLRWECAAGHRFGLSGLLVRAGRWCRRCAARAWGDRKLARSRAALERIVAKRGWTVLESFVDQQTAMRLRCERGHLFTLVPRSIYRPDSRCPTCASAARLAKLAAVARSRGGRLLSTTYTSTANQLWQCERGHRFSLSAEHVMHRGRWCPICRTEAAIGRFTKAMHALAATRGGAFLSGRYLGERRRMRWRCEKGHAFAMTARSANAGSWCGQCRAERRLDAIARIARRRGGRCLADEYRAEGMTWRCRRGHEWIAPPKKIMRGTWCRVCAGVAPLGLAEMRRVAESRGGTCLSTRYRSGERLVWECAEGHRWKAHGTTVRGFPSQRGTWCPQCAGRRPTIADLRAIARGRRRVNRGV